MLCGSMRTIVLLAFVLGALTPASADSIRCRFGPGATPAVTAPNKPHGSQIPIDTIVVAMQENRSFDHYFAQLRLQGQPHVRRVPKNASNPDPTNPSGPPIPRFHETSYCECADLDHSCTTAICGIHRQGKKPEVAADEIARKGDGESFLVALDKNSGEVVFETSTNIPEAPNQGSVSAPLAVKDKIIIGTAGKNETGRGFVAGAVTFGHNLFSGLVVKIDRDFFCRLG